MQHNSRAYVWIEKYLMATGSMRYYVEDQQAQAARDGAPLDAIHYNEREKRWHTCRDIKDNALRVRLGLPALPPEPSSFEALAKFDAAKAPPGFALPDPEQPEFTNATRAAHAAKGLAAYAAIKDQQDEDPETTVQDFLTDLRHFCDGHGYDFHALVDRGYSNYVHERSHARGAGGEEV